MSRHFSHELKGVCASRVDFDVAADGTLHGIRFTGGCDGNLKAIGRLAEGMDAAAVAEKLAGNRCGSKPTSCADLFARAVKAAIPR